MFALDSYHILLAALGISIILSFWLPRFVSGREPATSALLIVTGFAAFVWIPGMPAAIEPVAMPQPWTHAAIGLVLIFVIRQIIAWLSLVGTRLQGRERLVVAFYGVRGIGSVYYLAYAGHHLELVNEYQLWATIAFTILASTLVHGVPAGFAVERVTGEHQTGPTMPPRGSPT